MQISPTPPRVAATRPRPGLRAPEPGGRSARAWRWTVVTGLALLVLVGVHMVAHHFVVEEVGGLRTYRQVLAYIASPTIFVVESAFLITVTAHALLGVRGVLLDLGVGPRARRRIDVGLWTLGIATVAYGLFLIGTLASRA
jgi:succinate dehydrogenase hydrophobic anchor subunit